MRKMFIMAAFMIVATTLLAVSPAFAAEKFPAKPIKLVITHGAGGSIDLPSRGLAQYMQKYLGVAIICDNMEGAGGRRAMEYVFNQAKPDGYTIVASGFPSRLIGELIYDPKYKMKDFVHLGSWVGGDYRSIIVRADSPFKNFQDIVAESKKRKLTVAGGGGLGSTGHLQVIYLKEKVKLNIELVPFDGDAEVNSAVLGRHVDFGILPLSSSIRAAQEGIIHILAVHSPKRLKELPNVPTMKELGHEGVVIPFGVGGYAPPKTPADRAKVLSDAIAKAVVDPDFLKWAQKSSILLEPLGPEEFLKVTLEDYENISKVLPMLKSKK